MDRLRDLKLHFAHALLNILLQKFSYVDSLQSSLQV